MRGYSPAFQPDAMALQRLANRLTRGGTVPIDDAIARLQNPNQGATATVTPFFVPLTTANVPALLMPKNPRRISALLFSTGQTAFFSFGPPLMAAGVPLGVPLVVTAGTVTNLSLNGTVPIDDIWVWNRATAQNTFVGFEGTPAVH